MLCHNSYVTFMVLRIFLNFLLQIIGLELIFRNSSIFVLVLPFVFAILEFIFFGMNKMKLQNILMGIYYFIRSVILNTHIDQPVSLVLP